MEEARDRWGQKSLSFHDRVALSYFLVALSQMRVLTCVLYPSVLSQTCYYLTTHRHCM